MAYFMCSILKLCSLALQMTVAKPERAQMLYSRDEQILGPPREIELLI